MLELLWILVTWCTHHVTKTTVGVTFVGAVIYHCDVNNYRYLLVCRND